VAIIGVSDAGAAVAATILIHGQTLRPVGGGSRRRAQVRDPHRR